MDVGLLVPSSIATLKPQLPMLWCICEVFGSWLGHEGRLRVRLGHEGGLFRLGLVTLYEEEEEKSVSLSLYAHTEERPCEDTGRRQLKSRRKAFSWNQVCQLSEVQPANLQHWEKFLFFNPSSLGFYYDCMSRQKHWPALPIRTGVIKHPIIAFPSFLAEVAMLDFKR